MGSFDYLSVIISILMGLAVTHLVVGTISILQERATTKVYWVHLLWVANGIIYITQWWWFFHLWTGLEFWTLSIFYLLFGYTLLLTAFVSLLFPIHGSVTNYRTYFYQNFRWFLGLQLLWICLDVVEVMVKANLGLRPVPGDYFLLQIPLMLALLIGIFVKNPGYHGFLAVSAFALNVVYGVLISVAIS